MIDAQVVLGTQNPNTGTVIWTLRLKYPRFIHAEFMTHRVFSRNASSSRAIPVEKMLAEIWKDPAMPLHWGAAQSGMQAYKEVPGWRKKAAAGLWRFAGKVACALSWVGLKLGGHKQWVNRITEPWQHITVLVTATEWENFFALRDHEAAQPEIRELARQVKKAMSTYKLKQPLHGLHHLPFVTQSEIEAYPYKTLLKASVARCARVSYRNHDKSDPDIAKDVVLHDRLIGSVPAHASPAEHQATVDYGWHANFKDWRSYRNIIGL